MQKRLSALTAAIVLVPTFAFAQALQNQGAPSQAAPGGAPMGGPGGAQMAPPPPQDIQIDSSKRSAITDLLNAINGDALANAIANNAQMQVKQAVPEILSDALTENTTMTDAQKRAAVPSLQQNAVPKLVNDAGQVFATPQFHKDAIEAQYQAYAQNYSTSEIKDLTTFYRSPAGKKFIQVQEQVGRSVMSRLSGKYMPQAINAIRTQAQQQVASVRPTAGAK